jgi:hypothetical protein
MTAANPRIKLEARQIANVCYKYIMAPATSGAIVTDAIKFVAQKQEPLDTLKKLDERIETLDIGEEATAKCVF